MENALQYRLSMIHGSNHPLAVLKASGQEHTLLGIFPPLSAASAAGGVVPSVSAGSSVGKCPYAHQQNENAQHTNCQWRLMAMSLLTW